MFSPECPTSQYSFYVFKPFMRVSKQMEATILIGFLFVELSIKLNLMICEVLKPGSILLFFENTICLGDLHTVVKQNLKKRFMFSYILKYGYLAFDPVYSICAKKNIFHPTLLSSVAEQDLKFWTDFCCWCIICYV